MRRALEFCLGMPSPNLATRGIGWLGISGSGDGRVLEMEGERELRSMARDLPDDKPESGSARPDEAPAEAQCYVEIDDKRLYFTDVLTANRWIDWWGSEVQREFDGDFVCLPEQGRVVVRPRGAGSIDEG